LFSILFIRIGLEGYLKKRGLIDLIIDFILVIKIIRYYRIANGYNLLMFFITKESRVESIDFKLNLSLGLILIQNK
jgi:hypothetical protein